jgi:hypothetical protein
MKFTSKLILLFVAVSAFTAFSLNAAAQRRDYMTEAEIELVRDAQNIDLRIDVLTKMIDRRFIVLGMDSGGAKAPAKASEKWGEPPAGTRIQLLTDIRYLLQKAIDDIDDVAEHNENTVTQNKVNGELFPKAVRSLSSAAVRYKGVLSPVVDKTKDEKEKGAMQSSIEMCEQIIDAAATLPPETKKGKN